MNKKTILSALCGGLMLTLGAAPVEVKWYNEEFLRIAAEKKAEVALTGETLKIKGGGAAVTLPFGEKIPVVPGSAFRVSAEISGRGNYVFGIRLYDKGGKMIGNETLTARVGVKTLKYNDYTRVKAAYKSKTPAFANMVFTVNPKHDGTFSNLKIQFEKEMANPTLTPLDRTDWARASYAKLTQKAKMLKNIPLMFLGDSITYMWSYAANDRRYPGGKEVWEKEFKPLGAVNFGISGDRIEHVLWRITEGEQLACKPRVIVLLIGTNNFSRTLPQEIANGIDNLLKVIREKSPESKVLLLGIYPRRGTFPVEETNKFLVDVAAKNKVEFMNINEKLLMGQKTVSKEIFRDGLHLSPKGYEIVAAEILPKVKAMLEPTK